MFAIASVSKRTSIGYALNRLNRWVIRTSRFVSSRASSPAASGFWGSQSSRRWRLDVTVADAGLHSGLGWYRLLANTFAATFAAPDALGWRAAYFASFIFAALTYVVRLKPEESPYWKRAVEHTSSRRVSDVRENLRGLMANRQRRLTLLAITLFSAIGAPQGCCSRSVHDPDLADLQEHRHRRRGDLPVPGGVGTSGHVVAGGRLLPGPVPTRLRGTGMGVTWVGGWLLGYTRSAESGTQLQAHIGWNTWWIVQAALLLIMPLPMIIAGGETKGRDLDFQETEDSGERSDRSDRAGPVGPQRRPAGDRAATAELS